MVLSKHGSRARRLFTAPEARTPERHDKEVATAWLNVTPCTHTISNAQPPMSQRTTQLLRCQHDVSMKGSSIAVAARSPNAGATRNTRTAPSRNPTANAARPYATPAFVAFVQVRAITQQETAGSPLEILECSSVCSKSESVTCQHQSQSPEVACVETSQLINPSACSQCD